MKKNYLNSSTGFMNSIAVKFIGVVLGILILPIIITNLVSYDNAMNLLTERYIQYNEKLLEQGSLNIESYINSLKDISLGVYKDWTFYSNLLSKSNDYYKNSYNSNYLKNMLYSREEIDYITFYTTSSNMIYYYSNELDSKYIEKDFSNSDWYLKTLESKKGYYINTDIAFLEQSNIDIKNPNNYFILNRVIKNIQTREVIGILSIYINKRKIASVCNNIINQDERVLLFNQQTKQLIYSNQIESDIIDELSNIKYSLMEKEGMISFKENYIVLYNIRYEDIILIKLIKRDDMEKEIGKSLRTNTVNSLIISLIAITLATVFLNKISRISKQIVYSINEISNENFDVNIRYKAKDELGDIIAKINNMAIKLKNKINSEYKAKIALKNAQILALQTQITPHFIYNTLQAISTLAINSSNREIYLMTNSLADLLKYLLKESTSAVSIENELEYSKAYLYIMKTRFGNSYKINYDIDDDLIDYKVPKLIIQPLIENCIKHAFDNDDEKEQVISISVVRHDNQLVIEVADNGKGINMEIQKKIREWLEDKEFILNYEENIGLRNVISRLKLIYSEQASIDFTSKQGETVIRIALPYIDQK